MAAGRKARRIALLALGIAGLAVAGLLLLPLSLLLVVAQTRQGRAVGLLALVLLLLIGSGAWAWRVRGRAVAWPIGLAVVAAGLVGWIGLSRPMVPADRADGLLSVWIEPAHRPRREAWLPERDFVLLGAEITTRVVPFFSREQARRIRRILREQYREIDAEPAARSQPSSTALIFAGHYFAYVPPHAPGERLGAVVMLHGNGGNLRLMPWNWRPFADRNRVAIVAPTFGLGFWGPGGVEAIERARADALRRFPIDADRVILAGLSDGGVGVTRAASAHPTHYAGLVYLSPTMKRAELAAPAFADAWRGRPILVVQGGRDWNVRPETVTPVVEQLRRQGSRVDYRFFPGEDHFLYFGRRDEVLDLVEAWLRREVPGLLRPAGHS